MKSTYIIGEIGQNHNGSVDIAKLIVDLVSRPVREEVFNLELRPMDAVKMTKRDLNEELTDSQMNRPYDSPHSFGRTYGEHRACLELTDEEHFEVYRHAKSLGMDFVETLCSKGCMSLLKLFTPDRLKVASRCWKSWPKPKYLSSFLPVWRVRRNWMTHWMLSPVITAIYPYCTAYRSIPPGPTI